MPYRPDRLLIERRALDLPVTRRVIARLPHLTPEIIETPGRIPSAPRGGAREVYDAAKRTLIVGLSPGPPLRTCRPSADYELPLGSSCPGFCQYCYLQGSLGARPYVRVYADLDAIEAAVEERLAAEPGGDQYGAVTATGSSSIPRRTCRNSGAGSRSRSRGISRGRWWNTPRKDVAGRPDLTNIMMKKYHPHYLYSKYIQLL